MKKINFNDACGLTKAVIEGRKTMTRRVIPDKAFDKAYAAVAAELDVAEAGDDTVDALTEKKLLAMAPYTVGETLAVAQCLRDMGYDPREKIWSRGEIWGRDHTAAWTNKMFVAAKDCIHRIRITSIRIERLQDISDEDCLREGIQNRLLQIYEFDGWPYFTHTPREAFAALIDKVSRRKVWKENPYVYVYEFELEK